MPAACESTSDCCSVVQRSRAMRVVDSAPKPVDTPYTGFPDSDRLWICCQLRSIPGYASGLSSTRASSRATRATSSGVSVAPPISTVFSAIVIHLHHVV